MNHYYSFITELPDLEFNAEPNAMLPEQFLERLRTILAPEELEWVNLLYYRKFHRELASFIGGEKAGMPLPSESAAENFADKQEQKTNEVWHIPGGDKISEANFNPEDEGFGSLPGYIRETVIWKENNKTANPIVIANRLSELYFMQMANSQNNFLSQWAESEMNFLNFLAARRSELLSKEKEQQLIAGNEYGQLLLEFPLTQKIIKTEFSHAEKLEALLSNKNYLTREFEMDKLKWETIDEINKFEYFTVDIILGYLQKLMLLERWKKIFKPETPTDVLKNYTLRITNYE